MPATEEAKERKSKPRRELDLELDRLEAKIAELRVLFEQYFVDVQPQPPDQLQKETVMLIKHMLRAPFKNSQTRFRLRQLVQRYQTYHTYWERVKKQREEGTYQRDVFKAEMRERAVEEAKADGGAAGAAEKGLRALFSTYENALKKVGSNTNNLNFDAFKKSLLKQARELKDKKGVKKLSYKIIVREGKVLVKASTKN